MVDCREKRKKRKREDKWSRPNNNSSTDTRLGNFGVGEFPVWCDFRASEDGCTPDWARKHSLLTTPPELLMYASNRHQFQSACYCYVSLIFWFLEPYCGLSFTRL